MALSPLNQRRWRNFKANRRAWWSLWIFAVLFGLSLCAETVAIAHLSGQGRLRDVVAVAVVGGMQAEGGARGTDPIRPCGRCRQVLNEAAGMGRRDVAVFCSGMEGDMIERHRLSDLLPHAFGPADLGL